MNTKILILGAVIGMLAIVLGAYGAHGLKELISPESLQTFETGVRYQIYHALLLLFVGTSNYVSKKTKSLVFYLVLVGVILFSGSIYGLSTNNLFSFDFRSIGFITPIGGLLLILSWALLIVNFIKFKVKTQ